MRVWQETWWRLPVNFLFSGALTAFEAFDAKRRLIPHYKKTLGAVQFRGQRMIIPTHAAQILIDKYFKS
jgi:hypothetical protein